MRLAVRDTDHLAVTPADLSDLAFEGSPETVSLSPASGEAVAVAPVRSASLDRPSGTVGADERYDLSGLLEPPCEATVEWACGRATLRVVAYHYCALDDVLDFGDAKRQSPRQLERTWQDAFLARNRAEGVCDDLVGDSFRETYRAEPAWASASAPHQLEWPATRLLTDGWKLAGDGLALPTGVPRGAAPSWCEPGEIEYVGGRDRGVPPDVADAVVRLAASYLTVSKVPDRAVYESTEAGMTRYTLASATSTGIPDVDAVFARHARGRRAVL